MIGKCVNCGASINGNKCEYCGTVYESENITVNFEKNNLFGELTVGSETYKVYLGSVEINPICDAYRDANGTLHRETITRKRKFTLIEV